MGQRKTRGCDVKLAKERGYLRKGVLPPLCSATECSGTPRAVKGQVGEEVTDVFTKNSFDNTIRQKSDWSGLKSDGRFSKSLKKEKKIRIHRFY